MISETLILTLIQRFLYPRRRQVQLKIPFYLPWMPKIQAKFWKLNYNWFPSRIRFEVIIIKGRMCPHLGRYKCIEGNEGLALTQDKKNKESSRQGKHGRFMAKQTWEYSISSWRWQKRRRALTSLTKRARPNFDCKKKLHCLREIIYYFRDI